jgi:hypothetical protein
MGATSGAGTAYPSGALPVFSGVRVTQSLVLCVCFVDCCLSFFFWPLCCLFFFDIQILITPLVSSNLVYVHFCFKNIKVNEDVFGMKHPLIVNLPVSSFLCIYVKCLLDYCMYYKYCVN